MLLLSDAGFAVASGWQPGGANVSRVWGAAGGPSRAITNGNVRAVVGTDGIRVTRISDGAALFVTTALVVTAPDPAWPGYYSWSLSTASSVRQERLRARRFSLGRPLSMPAPCCAACPGRWHAKGRANECTCGRGVTLLIFWSYDPFQADERIWGLGERMTGSLDNKGQVIDFKSEQRNTRITIPFAVSSKRVGVFFNNPGWGGVDLSAADTTVWSSVLAKQLDLCVMTHPAAAAEDPYPAILEAYYDAIGLPTALPDWALGFWASKQRYASTTEIIDVVKNYSVRAAWYPLTDSIVLWRSDAQFPPFRPHL